MNEHRFRRMNFTAIPNEIIDELMGTLSGAAFRVLMYVCRRTFGFQRESASISLRHICDGLVLANGRRVDGGAGVVKSTAVAAIDELEKRGLLVVRRRKAVDGQHLANTYTILLETENGPVGGDGLPESLEDEPAIEARLTRRFQFVPGAEMETRGHGVGVAEGVENMVQKSDYVAQQSANGVVQKSHHLNRWGKKAGERKPPYAPHKQSTNPNQNSATRTFRAAVGCRACDGFGVVAPGLPGNIADTVAVAHGGTLGDVRAVLGVDGGRRLCGCDVGKGWAQLLDDGGDGWERWEDGSSEKGGHHIK